MTNNEQFRYEDKRFSLLADSEEALCNTCTCSMAHLAETLVVKETQSLTKVRGVVPVMSSHCAGDVPPGRES